MYMDRSFHVFYTLTGYIAALYTLSQRCRSCRCIYYIYSAVKNHFSKYINMSMASKRFHLCHHTAGYEILKTNLSQFREVWPVASWTLLFHSQDGCNKSFSVHTWRVLGRSSNQVVAELWRVRIHAGRPSSIFSPVVSRRDDSSIEYASSSSSSNCCIFSNLLTRSVPATEQYKLEVY